MKKKFLRLLIPSLSALVLAFTGCAATSSSPAASGKGKHIVLLAGDEEYRSEEGLPQLAKILSERHGFKCTVIQPVNPETGEIDPNAKGNAPGIEALDTADVCIMLLRFREWSDDQMKHFADYYLKGKPFIALRTSTHAFNYGKDSKSPYAKYSWTSKEWPGGFGKQVLGETWVSHWGNHKKEATRGIIEASAKNDPILNGVTDIFGDTDVYEAWPPADAKILVRGKVLAGMNPTDGPTADRTKKNKQGVEQSINDPMMPVLWTREHKNEAGKVNKIVCTTMGSATDLQNEGVRRIVVNAAYELAGLPVPAKANVDLVGEFKPSFYGFNGFIKGVKPPASR